LHSSPLITVTYTGNPTTGTYWGFSHVGLYIYRCDPTCLTCSGSAATQCLSCYPNATLSSSSTCPCNNPYYAVTTSNCSMSNPICTVCTPCSIGCESCTAGASINCTSCETNYYYYNGQVRNFFI